MSSKSSLRIVLVDPLGGVLFSGESLSALEGAAPAPDSSEAITQRERCPETLRSPVHAPVQWGSSGSGIYRAVDRGDDDDAPVTQDGRAA